MRLIVDLLVAIMLCGILAGVVMSNRSVETEVESQHLVRKEVRRFEREIMLQKALLPVTPIEVDQFPETIDPAWFGEHLPTNDLLPPAHPWVEVAPNSERSLEHPPVRATDDPKLARFWYNPRLGLVRARVPMTMSDDETLALYNYINGTALGRLFEDTYDRHEP